MPLSEHEQRLLEQMERALYAEDPKFATSLRSGSSGRGSRSRAALGVLAILAGIGLLVAGVATSVAAIGVVGFIVMLVGSVVAYSALRGPSAAAAAPAADAPAQEMPGRVRKARRSEGFMDRLEDRWRRRRDEGI